ncbi:MAG TPA: CBS domain-containing protein [Pyrinomonadaceae bacterium]|jgi:CBS domain-containing protein
MTNVKIIMTENPTCCAPDTSLQEVAKMMVETDCGCIPVVDENLKPIGMITDRDITVRAVARGKNPLDLTAGKIMTADVYTVTPETSIEECCRLMEKKQVRRVPVVDSQGTCCGMVAQADVANFASRKQTAEMVQEVSKSPSMSQSASL